jgi:hypothetical protein
MTCKFFKWRSTIKPTCYVHFGVEMKMWKLNKVLTIYSFKISCDCQKFVEQNQSPQLASTLYDNWSNNVTNLFYHIPCLWAKNPTLQCNFAMNNIGFLHPWTLNIFLTRWLWMQIWSCCFNFQGCKTTSLQALVQSYWHFPLFFSSNYSFLQRKSMYILDGNLPHFSTHFLIINGILKTIWHCMPITTSNIWFCQQQWNTWNNLCLGSFEGVEINIIVFYICNYFSTQIKMSK